MKKNRISSPFSIDQVTLILNAPKICRFERKSRYKPKTEPNLSVGLEFSTHTTTTFKKSPRSLFFLKGRHSQQSYSEKIQRKNLYESKNDRKTFFFKLYKKNKNLSKMQESIEIACTDTEQVRTEVVSILIS